MADAARQLGDGRPARAGGALSGQLLEARADRKSISLGAQAEAELEESCK